MTPSRRGAKRILEDDLALRQDEQRIGEELLMSDQMPRVMPSMQRAAEMSDFGARASQF